MIKRIKLLWFNERSDSIGMPVTGGDIDDLIHTELLVFYTIGDDKYIYEVIYD